MSTLVFVLSSVFKLYTWFYEFTRFASRFKYLFADSSFCLAEAVYCIYCTEFDLHQNCVSSLMNQSFQFPSFELLFMTMSIYFCSVCNLYSGTKDQISNLLELSSMEYMSLRFDISFSIEPALDRETRTKLFKFITDDRLRIFSARHELHSRRAIVTVSLNFTSLHVFFCISSEDNDTCRRLGLKLWQTCPLIVNCLKSINPIQPLIVINRPQLEAAHCPSGVGIAQIIICWVQICDFNWQGSPIYR